MLWALAERGRLRPFSAFFVSKDKNSYKYFYTILIGGLNMVNKIKVHVARALAVTFVAGLTVSIPV